MRKEAEMRREIDMRRRKRKVENANTKNFWNFDIGNRSLNTENLVWPALSSASRHQDLIGSFSIL